MGDLTPAIETVGLAKAFGKTRAIERLDLRIAAGSVFGLLGPNGAGKTTTIRILATLLRPDAGTARVLGHDVAKEAKLVRRKVSLTGQYAAVDEDLTGYENLILVSRLIGLSWAQSKARASEMLEAFGLTEAAKRQVRTYSGGMRRRIDIAASLVAPREVLFLDEPTSGLDPRSRNQVWDIVRAIAAQGTTVLLTTQYLEEADRLAERLAVIDKGRLLAEGTSRELKASVGGNAIHVQLRNPEQEAQAKEIIAKTLANGTLPTAESSTVSARIADTGQAAEVLTALTHQGIAVAEFTLGSPTLDDVFFALTGHAAVETTEAAR